MSTAPHHSGNDAERLARTIGLAVGVVFLLVGVLGFVPGVTTDYDTLKFADHHSEAKLLGIFQVSVLHNIVHILFGIAGIAASRAARNVPPYLVGSAVIYLVLTIYGIVVDKESSANFVPVNSADNWLHIALAVALAGAGLFLRKRLAEDARSTGTTGTPGTTR